MGGHWNDAVLLALYWFGYFALHSLLASLAVKRTFAARWPRAMPAYRLLFNLLAICLVVPPVLYIARFPGPVLWRWDGTSWWVMQILAALAVAGFLLTLRAYDGREFMGLRQWREQEKRVEDQERFVLSPLHRFVRHPWYFLGLVVVWTRDMTASWFVTAVAATLYIVVGSLLEERRLEYYHGDLYRQYRRLVPGLVPLPWRWLTKDQARRLTGRSARGA